VGDSGAAETVAAYRKTLTAAIASLGQSHPDAARLRAQLDDAIALADSGTQREALAALDACATELAAVLRRGKVAEATASVPQGLVRERVRALEVAAMSWQVARLRSVDGLAELIDALIAEEDTELHEIAAKVASLSNDVPDQLEATLTDLQRAIVADDAGAIASARKALLGEVQKAAAFLKDSAEPLGNCEENPFGVSVAVVAPLADALQAINSALQRI
jgi:hypothetical protein